jgi:hypothetical protein
MLLIDVGPGTFNLPHCNFPLVSMHDGEVSKPEPESPCHLNHAEVELPNGRGFLVKRLDLT